MYDFQLLVGRMRSMVVSSERRAHARVWSPVHLAGAARLATLPGKSAGAVAFSLPTSGVCRGLPGRVRLWEWAAQSGATLASGRDPALSPLVDAAAPLVDLSPHHPSHPDAARPGSGGSGVAAHRQLAQRHAQGRSGSGAGTPLCAAPSRLHDAARDGHLPGKCGAGRPPPLRVCWRRRSRHTRYPLLAGMEDLVPGRRIGHPGLDANHCHVGHRQPKWPAPSVARARHGGDPPGRRAPGRGRAARLQPDSAGHGRRHLLSAHSAAGMGGGAVWSSRYRERSDGSHLLCRRVRCRLLGPETPTSTPRDVLSLQLFLIATAVPLLLLAAQIDERKQAVKKVERQAEELDRVFEAVGDGLVVYDREGRELRANSALHRLLGLDAAPPEYAQMPLQERTLLFGVRDEQGRPLAPGAGPLQRALADEAPPGAQAMDVRARTLDGRELELNVSAAPLRDVAGELVGVVCVFRDQTDRKWLEREVAEQAEQLDRIVESMAEGLFVYDSQGQVVRTNAAARYLLGLDSPRPISLSWPQRNASTLCPT